MSQQFKMHTAVVTVNNLEGELIDLQVVATSIRGNLLNIFVLSMSVVDSLNSLNPGRNRNTDADSPTIKKQ